MSPSHRHVATLAGAASFCAAAFALLAVATSPAGAVETIKGTVTQVTLYRGQALVTRTITLPAAKNAYEIVVGDLPSQLIGDSLFAESSEGVEIRAVRYRTRAVGEEPREDIRKIDQQITELNRKIEANQKAQALLQKRSEYLDKLEGFVAPTAKADLAKGALDAAALEKVTLFGFEQRKLIFDEMAKLTTEVEALQKQASLLNDQKAELTSGSTDEVREAVLFVQKNMEGPESIRLNYLVAGCGWSPSYTFRVGKMRDEVQIDYSAIIQQMTGEDWNNVALSLSTASPSLSAASPGLAPFHVALQAPAQGQQVMKQQTEVVMELNELRRVQSANITVYRNTKSLGENLDANWKLNRVANDCQNLELLSSRDTLLSSLREVGAEGEGPSLGYRLATPVSLPSRSDQQMVRILQAPLKSRFYHVASPVLSSYVYREAELTNSSPEDLLAGPITVYLDGRFVGRGEIPTVARGETFVVGFGADPQLRAKRELADKSEVVQGGNREMTFKYRLVIENFKSEPVTVRVYDRLPYSERSAETRITLNELKDPLSEDKLYLRKERPKGMLRWEVEVPAASMGEKARLIEYGYKIEYDRNLHLTAATAKPEQQQQQEFEELQRGRQKK